MDQADTLVPKRRRTIYLKPPSEIDLVVGEVKQNHVIVAYRQHRVLLRRDSRSVADQYRSTAGLVG